MDLWNSIQRLNHHKQFLSTSGVHEESHFGLDQCFPTLNCIFFLSSYPVKTHLPLRTAIIRLLQNLMSWIKCVLAGQHGKPAGQCSPSTRVGKHLNRRTSKWVPDLVVSGIQQGVQVLQRCRRFVFESSKQATLNGSELGCLIWEQILISLRIDT